MSSGDQQTDSVVAPTSAVDRRRLYRLTRTAHLWSALVLATGVAVYAVTGFFVIHPGWLSEAGEGASERVAVAALADAPPPVAPEDREALAAARIVADRLGLKGRLEEIRRGRRGWIFTFRRPGTAEVVGWTPGNPEVELRVQGNGLQAVFDRLHHLHGYAGGWRYWLWAALLDLVSLSMFLFAGTGVYLWYRTKTDRRLGWMLLLGSSTFVAASIAHLLLSR